MPPFLNLSAERARKIGIVGILVAAFVFFAGFLDHFEHLERWLFFRYALYWGLALLWGLSCVAAGHLTIVKLLGRPLRFLEQISVGFAVGLVEYFLLAFALGMFHGLRAPAFFFLPTALLLPSARPFVRYLARARRHARFVGRNRKPRSALELAAIFLGVAAIGVIALTILTPENAQFDARWKHLALGEEMSVYGGIRRTPEGWTVESNPHLPSFVYLWAFLLPKASLFSKIELAAHLELVSFLFTISGISALTRRLVPGAPVAAAWAARFLFPGLFLYDSCLSCGADHIGAVFFIPSFLVLLLALQRLEWRLCVLCAIVVGGGIHSKLTSLLMLAPVPAIAFAVRFVWIWVKEKRIAIAGPLAAVGAALLVTTPFWLKNWIWYGDPLYPSLYKYLHLRPWTPEAPELFEYGYIEHQFWRPTRDLKGVIRTIGSFFTFSFAPNDYKRYHGSIPTFGSLFTLLLFTLPFFKKTRRIWGLTAAIFLSIFVWYWTHHQDRYLQVVVPWMAAVLAALIVLVWREGIYARVGVLALIALQNVWAGDIPFAHAHVMMSTSPLEKSAEFLSKGLKGNEKGDKSKFETYAPYSTVGAKLPAHSNVLLHDIHQHTGINSVSTNDWGGWQFGLSYGALGSSRAVYDELKSYGVTHLLWESGHSKGWDTVGGDLAFFGFALRYATKSEHVGSLTLAQMPKERPPEEPPSKVLVAGCEGENKKKGYATGLYDLQDLRVPVFGPSSKKFPAPRTEVKSDELEKVALTADFIVVAGKCGAKAPNAARSAFTLAATRLDVGGGQEIWVKNKR